MAARQIRFCTDGWRAVIADDYTFENVRYCAQGWADYLRAHGLAELGCVVGYDTRSESEDFASAGSEVLAGNGIKALLCQRSEPTPVISFGIIYRKAAGGVTITASHNPTIYNGFNVRSECGGAIDTEVIAELEGRIAAAQALGASAVSRLPKDEGVRQGLIQLYDPATPYVEQIRELIDWQPIRDAGLKVVHDAMYGAGIGWFEGLLGGGKTQVIPMGSVRNPCFGGLAPEPIPRSLRPLFDAVRREGAMVGLATDGDSDRLGVCDEHGNIVDPLRVNSLLTLYVLEVRGFRGPIVKTLSTQVDARPSRPALRRPGRRDGGRVQVRRARDDGVGRADRRRGERRLRFPQPHPRARRHRRRAVHPRLHGEDGEDAVAARREPL